MITPLMYILSTLGADYTLSDPTSISNMSATDQQLIRAEGLRLCEVATSSAICTDTTLTGMKCVLDTQAIGGKLVRISRLTSFMLQHIRDCAEKFTASLGNAAEDALVNTQDLSSDTIVLHIDGNPNYAYNFVYETMTSKDTYAHNIEKIAEVYRTISEHLSVSSDKGLQQAKELRLGVQSKMSYWKRLWLLDSLVYDGFQYPEDIGPKDFELVRKELTSFGLAGFVNPLTMYTEFSTNRIGKKENVTVPEEIVRYLERIVHSGGY